MGDTDGAGTADACVAGNAAGDDVAAGDAGMGVAVGLVVGGAATLTIVDDTTATNTKNVPFLSVSLARALLHRLPDRKTHSRPFDLRLYDVRVVMER
jgi:hypothetical protein